MYVDETAVDTSTTADTSAEDQLSVEVDGQTYEVEENYDFDQDGHNDTAVVEIEDGYVAFADTDGDGTADVAVQLDDQGTVLGGATYDDASGEWVEQPPGEFPTSNDEHHGDHGSDSRGAHGTITVDGPNGEFNAGEARYDSDSDGDPDTAVVTDADGTVYAFTDDDGDGDADTAVVIEADGDVTVAAHTGDEQWTVVEEGQLSADGNYQPDATASGSDAEWAEAK